MDAMLYIPKHLKYYVDVTRTESELNWTLMANAFKAPVDPQSEVLTRLFLITLL